MEETRKYDIPTPQLIRTVFYVLKKQGPMTTWKLHKLLYYIQAWSLVWDDDVMFDDEIEAWSYGPVVASLYPLHKGMYKLSTETFKEQVDKLKKILFEHKQLELFEEV